MSSGERTLPSGITITRLIAGIGLRRARRARLLRAVAVIAALPALAALVALVSGEAGRSFFERLLLGYLRFLIPTVMALQASSILADDVQNRSITYLLVRPIPRWTLPLGKYLGGMVLNLVLLGLSLVATYFIATGGDCLDELPRLLSGLWAVMLAVLHFGAMAAAFGSMVTSYPLAAMGIYLLIVDVGLGFVPGAFKVVSAGVHLTAVAGIYRPHTDTYFMKDPNLTAGLSLLVLLVATALWLLLSLGWASNHEFASRR